MNHVTYLDLHISLPLNYQIQFPILTIFYLILLLSNEIKVMHTFLPQIFIVVDENFLHSFSRKEKS